MLSVEEFVQRWSEHVPLSGVQFPIVRQKDEQAHGCYRTKERIFEIYDAMLAAQRSGQPYQTELNPPPGSC